MRQARACRSTSDRTRHSGNLRHSHGAIGHTCPHAADVVQRRGVTVEVSLAEIECVVETVVLRPRRVSILLRQPCTLGEVISFMPRLGVGKSTIEYRLRERALATPPRRHAVTAVLPRGHYCPAPRSATPPPRQLAPSRHALPPQRGRHPARQGPSFTADRRAAADAPSGTR
jgi:hypothetical protein